MNKFNGKQLPKDVIIVAGSVYVIITNRKNLRLKRYKIIS